MIYIIYVFDNSIYFLESINNFDDLRVYITSVVLCLNVLAKVSCAQKQKRHKNKQKTQSE